MGNLTRIDVEADKDAGVAPLGGLAWPVAGVVSGDAEDPGASARSGASAGSSVSARSCAADSPRALDVLRDWRALAACLVMSLDLVSTWLLNVTAYPGFNDVFPAARDIATAFGGLLYLAFARLALDRPRLFISGGALCTALAAGVIGSVGMFAAAALGSPLLAITSACLRAVGGCAGAVYLAFVLIGLGLRRSIVVAVVANLLKYLWMALLWPASTLLRSAVFVGLVFAVPLLLWLLARPTLGAPIVGQPAADLSVTNPLSFLPLTSKLFVAILLFRAGLGFAITYGSVDSYPQPTILAFVVLAVVVLVCLGRRSTSLDAFYAIAFALVLAGLLFVPWVTAMGPSVGALAASLSNTLLEAGSAVIGIAVWLMVAALGGRNLRGALPTALVVGGANSLGTEVGALSGHVQNYLAMANPGAGILFMTGITLAFALYNFLMARRFSFDATVAEVQPVHEVMEVDERDERLPDIDRACERLVAERGLTARESQVLALLARGRNAAYIQEDLTLSRNTVKSYVARVYGKLDVHSHQELIDLVERTGADAGVPVCASPSVGEAQTGTVAIALVATDDICEQIAAEYGLTPRENEILHYLAHGRNALFIQEGLTLSRNTVKTHLANIYAKLGIHSQQEVFDLVERRSAGCVGRGVVDARYRS